MSNGLIPDIDTQIDRQTLRQENQPKTFRQKSGKKALKMNSGRLGSVWPRGKLTRSYEPVILLHFLQLKTLIKTA